MEILDLTGICLHHECAILNKWIKSANPVWDVYQHITVLISELHRKLQPSDELIWHHKKMKTHQPITSSMSRSVHPSLTINTDKVCNQKNCKLPGNSYGQRERMKTRHQKNLEQTNEVWLEVLCSGHVPAVSLVRLAATLWRSWMPLLFSPF